MSSSELAKITNEHRIFPRVIAIFLGYMLYSFHTWFTADGTISVLEMKEWSIVGYATVVGAFVSFGKFYVETGNDNND